ncbi:sigma 54-interacting transcriptional regulator [Alcanivorax sp. IO_7]|nr:sigma 54-interacting transcriptional regulator [Alcanivorax sp. IO_7]
MAGKFEQADGGTLFLDEIGDMPLSLQARLLRVLQDREVTRLGGARVRPVSFSLVCATLQPLDRAIAEGVFARTCSTASTDCAWRCRPCASATIWRP